MSTRREARQSRRAERRASGQQTFAGRLLGGAMAIATPILSTTFPIAGGAITKAAGAFQERAAQRRAERAGANNILSQAAAPTRKAAAAAAPPQAQAQPRQRTRAGQFIRQAAAGVGAAAATAFPVAGGVVTRAAAAFRAGVQQDVANIERRHAETKKAVSGDGQTAQRFDLLTSIQGLGLWLRNNILIVLIAVVSLFFLFNVKKAKRKSRKRNTLSIARVQRERVARTPRKARASSAKASGFQRRIHGKLYTSPAAWGAAMKRLRK